MSMIKLGLTIGVASRAGDPEKDLASSSRTVLLPVHPRGPSDERLLAVVDARDDDIATIRERLEAALDRLRADRTMSLEARRAAVEDVLQSAIAVGPDTEVPGIVLAVWVDEVLIAGTAGGGRAYLYRPDGRIEIVGGDGEVSVRSLDVSAGDYLVLAGRVVARAVRTRDFHDAIREGWPVAAAATWLASLAAAIGSGDASVIALRVDDVHAATQMLDETRAGRRSLTAAGGTALAAAMVLVTYAVLFSGGSHVNGVASQATPATDIGRGTPMQSNPSQQTMVAYVFRMAAVIVTVNEAQQRFARATADIEKRGALRAARNDTKAASSDLRRAKAQLSALTAPPAFTLLHRDTQHIIADMIDAGTRLDRGTAAIAAGKRADARRELDRAATDVQDASRVLSGLQGTR